MTTGGKMISIKKLPVGYRLNPSDEELVNHHLKRKLLNIEEEYCLIPEFDIYKLPPWDLITKFNDLSDLAFDGGECFFYHRRSNPNRKQNIRKTEKGFWKVTGKGRKQRETDQTKWLKKILVYHLGKQKSAVNTGWAMHEYQIISDPRIVVCRIHKIKPKKAKEKVDSGSSEACSNGSAGATVSSQTQIETPEISPKTSVNTTMESRNLTLTSEMNMPEYNMSSPKQTQVVAEERLSLAENTYSDSLQLADLNDPLNPRILTREQSPFSKNAFIDGCDGNWSYLRDVILEEGGNMFISNQTPTDQSSNYVLLGFVSPPQHPQTMPTEEISPVIGNTSFNESGSELDVHGRGARLPISLKHGVQETNFKEAAQSTLNSQTPIPPPNSYLLSPEELQMLPELSSIYSMHPSSDSSGGGSPNAFHFGQSYESRQTILEVTRDFANESPTATQYFDTDSFLDAALASHPQSPLNSQTPIQPPDSYLLSPEEMKKLPMLSSICNRHLCSESSGRGSPTGHSYESRQANLEETRDFPSESPAAAQYLDIDSFLDSILASPPQSTLNPQTPIQPPYSYLPSPEKMQKLPELSSICNIHPSSESSGGGSSTGQSYESQQANLEVTRDFATGSPAASLYLDIDSMFDSFLASPPPPEAQMEEGSLCKSCIVTGGYGTEYCGVPYALGGTLDNSNPNISAWY